MDQAISNLSLNCNPRDACSALYLLSAPTTEMNMDLVKELADYLSELAPGAVIRYGDYPRRDSALKITVILSQLKRVERVKEYYQKLSAALKEKKRRREEIEAELKELIDASDTIPSIL